MAEIRCSARAEVVIPPVYGVRLACAASAVSSGQCPRCRSIAPAPYRRANGAFTIAPDVREFCVHTGRTVLAVGARKIVVVKENCCRLSHSRTRLLEDFCGPPKPGIRDAIDAGHCFKTRAALDCCQWRIPWTAGANPIKPCNHYSCRDAMHAKGRRGSQHVSPILVRRIRAMEQCFKCLRAHVEWRKRAKREACGARVWALSSH